MRKRILSLSVALLLVLSLCACAGSEDQPKAGLQVGFGRESITPMNYPVCLQGGSYWDRVSTGMLDMLYITIVAVSDGTQTYLVSTMDVKLGTGIFAPEARARITAETGIPMENIYLNATHTHSGVAIRYNWDNADRYREDFYKAAVKAAKAAVKDLAPATVSIGVAQTTGMAWVRHYTMQDGTVAGANFGNTSSGYVGHVREADNEMQLVRFTRTPTEEGEEKKDIVLASFPAHATFNEAGTDLSADFPGPFRDYVEQTADVLCAYFIGSAGDQVPSSRIKGEQYSRDYREYGKELGRYAVESLATMSPLEGGTELKAINSTYVGATHKEGTDPQRVGQAQEIVQTYTTYGTGSVETQAIVAKYGFSSYLDAAWTVKRSGLDDTREMEMKVLAIGDLSFVFAPYEMFGEQGQYIKANTPYPMTFIATCSEGDNSYIPSEAGFDNNTYESQVSFFARGNAEKIAEEYVNLLTQMQGGA